MFKRYFRVKERIDTVVNLLTCEITQESYPVVEVNWRAIGQDAMTALRCGLNFAREVALQSDVSLSALTLAVGYAR